MSDKYASIILDADIQKTLDYAIPEKLINKIKPGMRVLVPLRGKKAKGYVFQTKKSSSFPSLLFLENILTEKPLPKDLFELALWMSKYYATSLSKVLRCIIPTAIREEIKPKTQLLIKSKKTKKELLSICSSLQKTSPAQAHAISVFLKYKKAVLLTDLINDAKISKAPINTLIEKKILTSEKIIIDDMHLLENAEFFQSTKKTLTDEQSLALLKIVKSIENNKFHAHLLYGITGSGKTEVYLQAIQKTLDMNKTVIMLVPEISLTPQTIERFKSRFNNKIAVLHHKKSQGERYKAWESIINEEVQIVIGARSAIFSPMKNLGLIIVDEEHETSYKQSEEAPSYNAKNIAIKRAHLSNACVVLGSATPSLESYYNAKKNKYDLCILKKRPVNAHLPEIHIVNMKREFEKSKGFTHFSEQLLEGIKNRHSKGEQTLLFLNRRGYNHFVYCNNCSYIIKCPHCDVSLTYHKKSNVLLCHACLYKTNPINTCPSCKESSFIKYKGFGTEHVERSLNAIFPKIRTIRIDRDTTQKKHDLENLFKEFRSGKADVLIGTQMIVKGLHFPSVTLVGVLHADMALNIPDFRSSEYVFQLLTQVSGRAGRAGLKGEVIIQTHIPDNPIIKLAKHQDFDKFYNEEIQQRKLFDYPPFSSFVKINFSGPDEKKTLSFAEEFKNKTIDLLSSKDKIFPVVPSGRKKIKDNHRFFFLIKGPSILSMSSAALKVKTLLCKSKNIKVFIDVDPVSIFF